jgi:ligand-binding sensor domain-containing protein
MFIILVLRIDAQSQQQSGQWKSFTDMKSVRSAVQVGSSIWAATSGGVFVFDTVSGQYKQFNHSNGLSSNDMRCIVVEPGNRIWVGGADGFINTYNLETGMWLSINANRSNGDSRIGVQDLFLQGDTMFVATVFGVIPFKISKWEFGDTYASFGFLSSPVVKCVYTDQSHIFVGTDQGLAVAPLTASNLSAPDPWTIYTTIPGLSSSIVTALTELRDTLAIATDNGMAYYVNGLFGVVGTLVGKPLLDLSRDSDGKLLILRNEGEGFRIESLTAFSEAPQLVDSNSALPSASFVIAPSLWINTLSSGLTRRTISGWNYYYPNGPRSNLFSSLVVDDGGVLWAAPGSGVDIGFYRYNPSLPENARWKNFPPTGYGFYRVSLGTKGSVWVSSWGDGVVEIVGDTVRRKLNYFSKPSLPGAGSGGNFTYVVTGNVAVDPQGNTWIANRVNESGRSLLRLDTDTSATYFDNQYSPSDGWFHTMVIDHNGTKWLAGDLPWEPKKAASGKNGVYVFNESPTLFGIQTIGGWGYLSDNDGLKSEIVLSFVVDLDGAVWIGTSLGVTIIPDPQYPLQQTPFFAMQAYAPPFVQTIAVDALNNKWIGTKSDGVFVVNSDGTQLLYSYTTASTNGQLLSDDVQSIAIDQKRGIVYFGTGQGLSSLTIDPIQTSTSYSQLEIGPNPFLLPSNQPLTIRNLVAASTIKIMTVSGFVVKQFDAQGGGRAFWDGRDKNGALVSSGIYFIVAFAENGSQTVTGKVAVIRR